MNRRQKKVMQAQLLHEKEILDKLKGIYKEALDEVNAKIAELIGRETAEDENTLQGVIYQRQYQEAIRRQISRILDKMDSEQFTAVSDYLTKCYEDGFYSTLYDLHGQGIPLVFPIDQKRAVKAIQTDSKLSEGLYKRLGDDTKALKKTIAQSLTRGIAQGSNYAEIARYIAGTMVGYNPKKPGGAYARAMRIARTEGNRIANSAHMDAQRKAKEKGADIVKQWDATLDKRTRDSHAAVDGELREIDEPFSNGLMFPGDPHGEAAEVVNCRCSLLQRAKWALDEDELQTLKDRAEYFGLDKAESFEEFREKYIKAVDNGEESGIIKPYVTKVVPIAYAEKDLKDALEAEESAIALVKKDFPLLEEYLSEISFDSISDGSVAFNRYLANKGTNSIVLNAALFSDRKTLIKILSDDYATGWSFQTDRVESFIAHELGHNLHIALALKKCSFEIGVPLTTFQQSMFEKAYNQISQDIYLCAFDDESFEDIQKACVTELGQMVYLNPHELIAQSFANYYYGTRKSEIAKKIVSFFKKGML